MGTVDAVLFAYGQLVISTSHSFLIVQISTQCCVFGATSPGIVTKILRE